MLRETEKRALRILGMARFFGRRLGIDSAIFWSDDTGMVTGQFCRRVRGFSYFYCTALLIWMVF